MVLICIPLVTNDVQLSLMCSLAFQIVSFMNCVLKSFVNFYWELPVFTVDLDELFKIYFMNIGL